MRSGPKLVRSSTRSPVAPSPSSSTSRRCGSRTRPARRAANGSPRRCAACSTCRRDVLTLRIATRGSPLALRQAGLVAEALASAASSAATPRIATELVVVETVGDLHRDPPIGAIGGQGAFVKEVEQALIDGRADLAVHSAKDLPSSCGSGELAIVAVPTRADPRDALVRSEEHTSELQSLRHL